MCEQPIRALVIDDEPAYVQELVGKLHERGFEAVGANSGSEALEVVRACGGNFQVALIDQYLGPPDGIDTMRMLHDVYPLIEVIIMSAREDFRPGDEAVRMGAYRFMSKAATDAELDMNIRTAARFGQEHRLRGVLEMLLEAGQHLSSAHTQEEVYRGVYDLARKLLPAVDTFFVVAWDPLNRLVSFPYATKDNARIFPSSRSFDLQAKRIAEYIIETAKPIYAPEGDRRFREEHQLAAAAIDGDTVSEIGVPMFWQGQVVGALLVLCHHSDVHYSRVDLNALQALANQVIVSVQHVDNQEEATQLSEAVSQLVGRMDIEPLYSVIVHGAHRLIGPDFTGLIVQDESGTLRAVTPVVPENSFALFENPRQQGGITRWVVDQRRYRRINDTLADPLVKKTVRERGVRSMLVMPLIHQDRVLGVLYAHTLALRSFSEHDINLWQAYAASAAAALWSASERRQDIELYRELAQESGRLAGQTELVETLRQVSDSARVVAHAESCWLAYVDPATGAVLRWVPSPAEALSGTEQWMQSPPEDLIQHISLYEKAFSRSAVAPEARSSWRPWPLFCDDGRLLAMLYCRYSEGQLPDQRTRARVQAFLPPAEMALQRAARVARRAAWQRFVEQLAGVSDRQMIYQRFADTACIELHATWAVFLADLGRGTCSADGEPITPAAIAGNAKCMMVLDLTAPLGSHLESLLQSPEGLLIINDLQQTGGNENPVRALVAVRVWASDQMGEASSSALVLGFDHPTAFSIADLEELRSAAEQVAATLDRLDLLEQRDGQLKAVQEIFRVFRHRRDARTLLDVIAGGYRTALGVDVCTVLGYDPEQGFIDQATAGLREMDHFTPPDSEAYRQRFLDQSEPIVIQDALEDELLRHSGFVQREGIRTIVVYRLLADGEPLGLLFANYRRIRAVTEEDQRAIRILGDIAAAVLRETKLQRQLSETEKRLQRLTVLIWMSMLEDSWRHSLVGKAATIRNCVSVARALLNRTSVILNDARPATYLDEIDRLAQEIANAPIRVPQSFEMQPELIPLAPLVEEVTRRAWKSPSHSSLLLSIDLAALEGALIRGYRRWLVYGFECLLMNAIKAMSNGGTLTATGLRNGDWAEVRIRDTGPGVPAEDKPYLFKWLVPKEHDQEGRGVGALLAASIIEEHDGTVELEETGPLGTTVLVRLRLTGEAAK